MVKKMMFLLLCVWVVCAACSKSEKSTGFQDTGDNQQKKLQFQGVILSDIRAAVLQDDGVMNNLASGGGSIVRAGDVVELKMVQAEDGSGKVPEMKKDAVRLSDKNKRNFYHVIIEDADYWIQDYAIAPEAIPGIVISDEAFLCTDADISTMTSWRNPLGTIVGIHKKDSDSKFLCISSYLPYNEEEKQRSASRHFVEKAVVSEKPDDIAAYTLLLTAQSQKEEAVKRKQLEAALEKNTAFKALIQKELDILDGTIEEGSDFTGTYRYVPLTDNFYIEYTVQDTDGVPVTKIWAKHGSVIEISDGIDMWYKSDLETGEHMKYNEDTKIWEQSATGYPGLTTVTPGDNYPLTLFEVDFMDKIRKQENPYSQIQKAYSGTEEVAGVQCWVFDLNKIDNRTSMMCWVDPTNGATLKAVNKRDESGFEVTRYDLEYQGS